MPSGVKIAFYWARGEIGPSCRDFKTARNHWRYATSRSTVGSQARAGSDANNSVGPGSVVYSIPYVHTKQGCSPKVENIRQSDEKGGGCWQRICDARVLWIGCVSVKLCSSHRVVVLFRALFESPVQHRTQCHTWHALDEVLRVIYLRFRREFLETIGINRSRATCIILRVAQV